MNWYILLKTDIERITHRRPTAFGMLKVLIHPSLQAIALYRIGHACYQAGLMPLAKLCQGLSILLTSCDIDPKAEIAEGLSIGHTSGVVIGKDAKIGPRVTIMQNVTIGRLSPNVRGMPSIGADVAIGAGAVVLGPITVGDGTGIGANALVIEHVPPLARVAAEQGKVIKINGVRQQPPSEHKILELERALMRLEVEQADLKQLVAELQNQLRAFDRLPN